MLVALWLVFGLTAVVRAQFGTIQIDWATEAAGRVPHLVGVDAESAPDASNIVAESAPDAVMSDADAYEDAWWRGGFGEYTEADWFAASTVPRTERPTSVSYAVGGLHCLVFALL